MSRIEWKSIEDKYEAIGYLAKPGVIETIEATVPEDKLDKFKEEYKGKYSEEFPYVTKPKSKYGYQFRIYLSDTDGCPSCLVDYLDNKYGNRLNDNHFIAELVKEYGFKFTKTQQNSEYIHKCVIEKAVQFIMDNVKERAKAKTKKEKEAEAFFDDQAKVIEDLKDFKNTEKTVAYFYINTDGSVVVRKSDDYIPTMIEIAGGRYVFKDLKNSEGNAPSVKLTMEEFYATAVDADYLIYNGTIDGQVSSLGDLEAKSNLFTEFKAVKDGNVWYTGKNLYQATDTVGELISDIHLMLTDGDASQMTFLEKMK